VTDVGRLRVKGAGQFQGNEKGRHPETERDHRQRTDDEQDPEKEIGGAQTLELEGGQNLEKGDVLGPEIDEDQALESADAQEV